MQLKASYDIMPLPPSGNEGNPSHRLDVENRRVEEDGSYSRLVEAPPGAIVVVHRQPVVTVSPATHPFATGRASADRARVAQ
jgi:hypothetical protein